MNHSVSDEQQAALIAASEARMREYAAAAEARHAARAKRRALKSFTPGVDWQYSDAGQVAAGIWDLGNCVVRAYANATGARFVDADAACELLGRKRNQGFSVYRSIGRVAPMLGFGHIKVEHMRRVMKKSRYSGETYPGWKGISVHTFLKDNPTGRFIITIRRHATAIVDGKVLDGYRWSKLCRVDGAWKVTAVQGA